MMLSLHCRHPALAGVCLQDKGLDSGVEVKGRKTLCLGDGGKELLSESINVDASSQFLKVHFFFFLNFCVFLPFCYPCCF